MLRTLAGHSGPVRHVALTPDGQRALSASDDNTLKLWNLESGEVIRTLAGHRRPVWHVALTPDGQRALSASEDNTLKLWNLPSGEIIATFHADAIVYCCAIQDNRIVAGDASGRVYILLMSTSPPSQPQPPQ
ncbi:MAG: WD40 repeat domain-containing protein [Acidobacteriota bacterium]